MCLTSLRPLGALRPLRSCKFTQFLRMASHKVRRNGEKGILTRKLDAQACHIKAYYLQGRNILRPRNTRGYNMLIVGLSDYVAAGGMYCAPPVFSDTPPYRILYFDIRDCYKKCRHSGACRVYSNIFAAIFYLKKHVFCADNCRFSRIFALRSRYGPDAITTTPSIRIAPWLCSVYGITDRHTIVYALLSDCSRPSADAIFL